MSDPSLPSQLRGELRKTAAPLLLVVLVIFGVSVWRDLGAASDHFAAQSAVASGQALFFEANAEKECSADPESSRCHFAKLDLEGNENYVENGRRMGAIAESFNTPAAVIAFTSRQMTAGFGWLVIAAIAMVLVVGERRSGTSRDTVRLLGRRRFPMAKTVVVATAAITMLLITAGALIAATPTYAHQVEAYTAISQQGELSKPVRVEPDATWSSPKHAVKTFGQAALTIVVVSALAVAGAVWFRSMGWYGLTALAVTAAVFAMTRFTAGSAHAPLGILDRAYGWTDSPPGLNDVRFWDTTGRPANMDTLPIIHGGSVIEACLLAAIVLLIASAALWRFQSAELGD